jgi:uncharacterized protein YdaU (DUF1376 family)
MTHRPPAPDGKKPVRDNLPLPYYRFYVADYRASRRVQRLGYIARGLYRELLDECWLVGSLPTRVSDLADICGCDVATMQENWPTLQKMFSRRDGRWINERLESERTASDKVRVAKSLAGKKSARNRRQKRSTSVEHPLTEGQHPSTSSSKAEQSSSSPRTGVETPVRAASESGPMTGDVSAFMAALHEEASNIIPLSKRRA